METPEIYRKFVLDYFKNLKSTTFCPLYWNHIAIFPAQHYSYCCIAKAQDFNAQEPIVPINEYWKNSSYINRARKNSLESKKVKECYRCYIAEDKTSSSEKDNKNSQRLMAIEEMQEYTTQELKTLYENVRATLKKEEVPHHPTHYDIKFGNLCNLKCRTCNSESSSQIAKEYVRYKPKFKSIDDATAWDPKDHSSEFDWPKKKRFWNDFEKSDKNIVKFKSTGGEPLFNDTLITYLKKLVDEDKAKDIKLDIVTNGTIMPEKLVRNVLCQFNTLTVNISIDGVKNQFEYLRYPAKWKVVDKNIKTALRIKDEQKRPHEIKFQFNPTLSILNIFDIVNVIKYSESLGLRVHTWSWVDTPKCLNPNMLLDDSMKSKVLDYYSTEIKNVNYSRHKLLFNQVVEHIKLGKTNNYEIKQFARYVNIVDDIRKQNFKISCPKEYDLVKKYFNDNRY